MRICGLSKPRVTAGTLKLQLTQEQTLCNPKSALPWPYPIGIFPGLGREQPCSVTCGAQIAPINISHQSFDSPWPWNIQQERKALLVPLRYLPTSGSSSCSVQSIHGPFPLLFLSFSNLARHQRGNRASKWWRMPEWDSLQKKRTEAANLSSRYLWIIYQILFASQSHIPQ